MQPIVIDLVLALVLALLSAYKKAGTNKTAAFILGLIMGLVPVLNVLGIIYLLEYIPLFIIYINHAIIFCSYNNSVNLRG